MNRSKLFLNDSRRTISHSKLFRNHFKLTKFHFQSTKNDFQLFGNDFQLTKYRSEKAKNGFQLSQNRFQLLKIIISGYNYCKYFKRGRPMKLFLGIAFLITAMWPCEVLAQFCDCEIPKTKRTSRIKAATRALTNAEPKEAEIIAKHFPFGVPKSPTSASGEFIVLQSEWVTWYDSDLRTPLWVGYQLSKAEARRKRFPRQDCFRKDPRLADAIASICADYDEPLYDRGHMLPANDAKRNQAMMDNSFLFSNMAPQRGNFNRKIWENLESKVNEWAEKVGVYIITGSIFDRDGDGARDPDENAIRMKPRKLVAVPTHFYKIILHIRDDGKFDSISFMLPHNNKTIKNRDKYLTSRIVTVDEIEQLTGIDFFPDMPNSRQNTLESTKATSLTLWLTN